MTEIICYHCKIPYPSDGMPHRCLNCGGDFIHISGISYNPRLVEAGQLHSRMWRYVDSFGLPDRLSEISLGEGSTPLVWSNVDGKKVGFKLEYTNPTGSFKDRGTSILVSLLKYKGVGNVVEDSSGNAGASLAAYAALAGIKVRIYVPEYASGPKQSQIQAYGAEIIRVKGPRSAAAEAVALEAAKGSIYASHAYLPFGIPGYATIVYELLETIGGPPGVVITPVGQGNLLIGLILGCQALIKIGLLQKMPKIIGVQSRECAPLWAAFYYGANGYMLIHEGNTIAEGIRIKYPIHGDYILNLMKSINGEFLIVSEEDIVVGINQLAKIGLYVEPTSAVVWKAIEILPDDYQEPIVAIITGSGLKSNQTNIIQAEIT